MNPVVKGGAVAVALALAMPLPLPAQRAREPLPRFALTLPAEWGPTVPERVAMKFGHPDDYRWEGLLIGAIGGGVFGAYLGYGLCHDLGSGPGDNCLVSGLFGAAVVAVAAGTVGGLVGGLIPKAHPDSAP